MPTLDFVDDKIGDMHDSIEEGINTIRGDEKLIDLGDWSSVVGEGQVEMVKEKGTIGMRDELSSACKIAWLSQTQYSGITNEEDSHEKCHKTELKFKKIKRSIATAEIWKD
jgi:hypothetical protein